MAALLRMFRNADHPAFAAVTLVLPPGRSDREALAALRSAFTSGWAQWAGSELAPEQLDLAFRAIRCAVSPSLEASSIVKIVQGAPPQSAFIVVEAAKYRASGVDVRQFNPPLPEDTWVSHLDAATQLIHSVADISRAYVVLDVGQFLPERPENRDLLQKTRDGLLGFAEVEANSLSKAAQFEQWRSTAEEGRIGPVLADIDRQDLRPITKVLLKAQILKIVGALPIAKALLEADPDLFEETHGEVALRAAILAEEVDAGRMSAVLLNRSISELHDLKHIESALHLADRLSDRDAAAAAASSLSSLFPSSSVLRAYRALALVRDRRFREAADVFRQGGAEDQRLAEFYGLLADLIGSGAELDGDRVLDELRSRFPEARNDALRIVAESLEVRGRRVEAIDSLLSDSDGDRRSLGLAFSMIERGRLVLDIAIDDGLVLRALGVAVSRLASDPLDGASRLALMRILSPEVLGTIAAPMMAKLLIDRTAAGVRIRQRPKVEDRIPACSPDKLEGIMRLGLTLMGAQGGAILGKFIYPRERLTETPEAVLLGLARLVEYMGERILEDADVRTIDLCLLMAASIAPLGSEPDEDLVIMRLAAGRLAIAGRVQRARDLVEQTLVSGRGSPHRRRLAWFAFADTYARLGNGLESMIGLACAFSADDEATWDEIFYEILLLLRILRDVGLLTLARPLIATARRALQEMGASVRYGDRIDTVELQLDFADYDREESVQPDRLRRLIERSEANLRRVLASKDEAEPATILFANIMRLAEQQGVEISASARQTMQQARVEAGPGMAVLFDALGSTNPSLGHVVALAARLEKARYGEDAGYDMGMLVVAARRLLEAEGPRDDMAAFYGIEVLADQTARPADGGPVASALDGAGAPAAAAMKISGEGLAVVGLGRTDAGLVRAVAIDGDLVGACLEPEDVFANDRLAEWEASYPYGYRDVEAFNEFYTSTEGIGVSEMPERAVVIASADLQGFPPNLLRIGPDLAGKERRLAASPSLGWLRASRRSKWKGDGRISAWIPDAIPEEGLPTLAVLASRLAGTFADHGVTLSSGFEPPAGIKGSDMMIVAAHGGVAEDKRFFRVVTDDVDLALASSTISGALEQIGVVVLFVCSGGRLDKHPGASAMVGLARRLLDNGCRAVVAPPWPLRTNVPPYWLPTFLDRWSRSAAVIDACFDANCAVRKVLGDDPATDLAMTVYGDPLTSRSL
ncbi:hypothetical protein [Bradyrhizobium ganzhouense]|uniref:hypothetical protein n=1 Tax=Bradyrhizobium ganzhouense TaxID=1179767 RepID=UPI003CFA3C09